MPCRPRLSDPEEFQKSSDFLELCGSESVCYCRRAECAGSRRSRTTLGPVRNLHLRQSIFIAHLQIFINWYTRQIQLIIPICPMEVFEMSKTSLILMIGIWCAIVVPSLWIRHRNSKLSSQELKERRLKWRIWWGGNSLGVIILKGLLLIGMLCCAANALLKLYLLVKS